MTTAKMAAGKFISILAAFLFAIVGAMPVFAQEPENLVPNAGFEEDTEDWVYFDGTAIETSTEIFHSGARSMKFGNARGGIKLAPGIEVKEGTMYKVGAWVYGQTYLKSAVFKSDSSVEYWDHASGGEDGKWTYLEADVDIPTGSGILKVDITIQSDAESILVDDILFAENGVSDTVIELPEGAANLAPNASFEEDTEDWVYFDGTVIETSTEAAHDGARAMVFGKDRNGVKLAPGIEVAEGKNYAVSAWVYGQAYLKSALFKADGGIDYADIAAGGTDGEWTRLEGALDIPESSGIMKADITFQSDSKRVLIDDVSFSESFVLGENLFPNPDFEEVTEDWLLLTETPPEYSTEVFHNGAQSIKIPSANGIKLLTRIDVVPGVTYELTAWVYGKVNLIGMMYDNADNPIDYYNAASPFMGGGEEGRWTEIKGTFLTDDERVGNLSVEFRSASAESYVDDISFRSCGVVEDSWEPTPSDEPVKLGCYYFNNWVTAETWTKIKDFQEVDIEPVIGYYRDESPEVQEFHIEQATQHGISYWVFDWYYDMATNTVLQNNAALDNGFLNASNCNDMDFAIMWCNEEKDISSWTEENLLTMTRTICERYLSKGNYLKTPDGKNIFAMTRPDRLIEQFGLQGTKAILKAMDEAAAEYGGFYYMVIKYPTEADMTQLKAAGFDACTLYSYSSDGMAVGAEESPYEKILPAVEPIIRAGAKADIMPIIPCVSPGWDSRPWAGMGGRGSWRSGSTPELFEEMCNTLKKYANPELNMVMVGTWNEFGEGSHIEPTTVHGCSYLDALQRAFFPEDYIEHEVLVPTDEEKAEMDYADIPSGTPETGDDGNLVVNPSFERGYGWATFGSGALEYSTEDFKDGEQSLILTTAQKGVKSVNLIAIEPGTAYDVSVWVKGNADLTCALYDADAVWTNEYFEFGEKAQSRNNGAEWVQLKGTLKNLGENVSFIDVEVVNANENDTSILVDLAEVRIVKPLSAGAIAGIIVSGIVLLAAVIVLVVLLYHKSLKDKIPSNKQKKPRGLASASDPV